MVTEERNRTADAKEKVVVCLSCNRRYLQRQELKRSGAQFPDRDVCPYCGACNHESTAVEYTNRPIAGE